MKLKYIYLLATRFLVFGHSLQLKYSLYPVPHQIDISSQSMKDWWKRNRINVFLCDDKVQFP